MKTVLVTGSGLIGCHSARTIIDQGYDVVLLDREPKQDYIEHILGADVATIIQGDIQDLPLLVSLSREHNVLDVVHTAGLIGAKVYTRPYPACQVNISGTINIAEMARLGDIRRVVFCSSMAVYSLSRQTETAMDEDYPIGPDNIYGATKLAAEQLLRTYGKTFGFDAISLRLAGVYGYGPYVGGSWMGQVLHGLISDSLAGRSSKLEAHHLGINEYVYVKDVATAIVRSLQAQQLPNDVFNIGSGVLTDYKEIVKCIESLLPGTRITVRESSDEMASYLKRSRPFSVERARQELGFAARYDITMGLSDFIESLRRVGTNARH